MGTYAALACMNGDYDESIKMYKQMMTLPDTAMNWGESWKYRARANLAATYLKAGKEEEGNNLFDELYEKAENNFGNLWTLGWVCYENKVNREKAIGWAKEAVEVSKEENPMVLHLYAELLFESGDKQKALEIGTKAVERDDYPLFKDALEKYKAALKE